MTEITGRGRRAKELFLSGYNCAQSVAGAYADVIGLPETLVLRLSQPFGGGMGRMREVCGTLSGALFVVAQLYGGEDPSTDEEKRDGKARVYAVVQDIASSFRAEHGTIICPFSTRSATPRYKSAHFPSLTTNITTLVFSNDDIV